MKKTQSAETGDPEKNDLTQRAGVKKTQVFLLRHDLLLGCYEKRPLSSSCRDKAQAASNFSAFISIIFFPA